MSRKRSGSLYESYGKLYLSLTLDKRIGICLETCRTREEAEIRPSSPPGGDFSLRFKNLQNVGEKPRVYLRRFVDLFHRHPRLECLLDEEDPLGVRNGQSLQDSLPSIPR